MAQIMSKKTSSSLPDLPETKVWCHSSEKAKIAVRTQARIKNLKRTAPGLRSKNARIQSPPRTEYSKKWTILWKSGIGRLGMSFPGTEEREKINNIHKRTGSQVREKLVRGSFLFVEMDWLIGISSSFATTSFRKRTHGGGRLG